MSLLLGGKYKITKIEDGVASGFLLDDSGKPTHKDEAVLASMTYLKSTGYKLVASDPDNVSKIPLPPIKKFKVTHAERPEIPQVFNMGDKVSFRGKMYFVKYVNPKDHMVQIELAKIRHGKVIGVVTGAIVNVKPDTIFPWGMKPNNKAIEVGGDEWNKNTAMRLEYDYAKVKPLLEKIAADAVGGKTRLKPPPRNGMNLTMRHRKRSKVLGNKIIFKRNWNIVESITLKIKQYMTPSQK